MEELSLFGPAETPPSKPRSDEIRTLRILVTVKAAPNPSERYGETVCVAGVSIDLDYRGWIRLYPINFRDLGEKATFHKYDIIRIDARPARQDQRPESWRPILSTLRVEKRIKGWPRRATWLDDYLTDSMCEFNEQARQRPDAPSLGLIRVRDATSLKITPHGGWTADQQRKIDAYVNQFDLLDEQDRTPLQAPRFKATYHYRCADTSCRGHAQGFLDWEFVATQYRMRFKTDEEICAELNKLFFDKMFDGTRRTAFFVGNQAKRAHTYSVLGVYYPER